MINNYDKWRYENYPCGRTDCEFYSADDQYDQACMGEDSCGDPMPASCKKYIPDPHVVESRAIDN